MPLAGLTPDVGCSRPLDSEVPWIHRRMDDAEAYYLVNRSGRPQDMQARFRVSGKNVVLWHLATGQREPAGYTMSGGHAYQLCQSYQQLANRPAPLMDAHMLVALAAPRPLLLQTGSTYYWSDPKGEFLSAVAATPVYTLLGQQKVPAGPLPTGGAHAELLYARGRPRHCSY